MTEVTLKFIVLHDVKGACVSSGELLVSDGKNTVTVKQAVVAELALSIPNYVTGITSGFRETVNRRTYTVLKITTLEAVKLYLLWKNFQLNNFSRIIQFFPK